MTINGCHNNVGIRDAFLNLTSKLTLIEESIVNEPLVLKTLIFQSEN
jgi:hypothetical protein